MNADVPRLLRELADAVERESVKEQRPELFGAILDALRTIWQASPGRYAAIDLSAMQLANGKPDIVWRASGVDGNCKLHVATAPELADALAKVLNMMNDMPF